MKVFIAAQDIKRAREFHKTLSDAGHFVVSTWHSGEGDAIRRTASHEESQRSVIAETDTYEIDDCHALALIASDEPCPGGKFVEAGYALGKGKIVVCIGKPENMLMWHRGMFRVNDEASALSLLASLSRFISRTPIIT
jgi:nucleoside 2-deoxyribosyltransferase